MYTVYILYSEVFKKSYVGQTGDLHARMIYHNETGIGTFTSKYRPWRLIHTLQFETRAEAMKKEKWFKTGAGREEIERIKQRCGVESAAADSSSGS